MLGTRTKKLDKKTESNGSYSDYVCDYVRNGIISGDLKPGDRLRESEISKLLEVSRTPIREAMKSLEAEGLIVMESWKGVIINDLDRRQIIELYDVRILLEGLAARLAAANQQPAGIEILQNLQNEAKKADDDDHLNLARINRAFHQQICEASQNPFLIRSLNNLRTSLALMRGNAYGDSGKWGQVLVQHQQILDAIKAGDGDLAQQMVTSHIQEAAIARLLSVADLDIPVI